MRSACHENAHQNVPRSAGIYLMGKMAGIAIFEACVQLALLVDIVKCDETAPSQSKMAPSVSFPRAKCYSYS